MAAPHKDLKLGPQQSVLDKSYSADYTATCKAKKDTANRGFFNPPGMTFQSEVHHLVCEISMKNRVNGYTKGSEQYDENCLWVTPWDINNEDNLIGLPRNRRFRVTWVQEVNEDLWTPVGLPSHQVDHLGINGYTVAVEDWLKATIWDGIQGKKDESPHPEHLEQIKTDLVNGQKEFLGRLKRYGERTPNQKEGWKNRDQKAYEDTWYLSFSMAEIPSHRYPGVVRGQGKNKKAVDAFDKIMKKLT